MPFPKKIGCAFLSGCALLILSWFYINSPYALGIEDDLYKKIAFLRFLVLPDRSAEKAEDFVFINTGEDLSLVDKKTYGNTAISDRRKIARLLDYLRKDGTRPLYTVIDLDFDTPSDADSLLQAAIDRTGDITIPVHLDTTRPLITSPHPTIVTYTTFSQDINKFRLDYKGDVQKPSLPLFLYNTLYPLARIRARGHLCLNYIWPSYYLNNLNVPPDSIDNIGALLAAMDIGFIKPSSLFDGKIVCIGNFTGDLHNTPVGQLPGTLVLSDVYLTLRAGHHIVPYGWILFVLLVFSTLSYFAWFKPLPEVDFRFRFIFSRHLSDFLKGYVSFLGAMLLTCLISFFVFHLYINILFSAFVLSGIDYFSHKKYTNNHA